MMKIYNPQYAITNKDISSQILHTCDYIDGGMEEATKFTIAIMTLQRSNSPPLPPLPPSMCDYESLY